MRLHAELAEVLRKSMCLHAQLASWLSARRRPQLALMPKSKDQWAAVQAAQKRARLEAKATAASAS